MMLQQPSQSGKTGKAASARFCTRHSMIALALTLLAFLTTVCFSISISGQEKGNEKSQEKVKTHTADFENCDAGIFESIETGVGVWTTIEGVAKIDDQLARTGNQCLQIAGGDRSVVEFRISDEIESPGMLNFSAERWTNRSPFQFRIERQVDDSWIEIYNGDDQIKVGRGYRSDVSVPVEEGGGRVFRFACISPQDTGILIDDFSVSPAIAQTVADVKVIPMTIPALIGAKASPLLKLRVSVNGTLTPNAATSIKASLTEDTHLEDLENLQVFFTGNNPVFDASNALGEPVSTTKHLEFEFEQTLEHGDNYFWIAATVAVDANIDHRVGLTCRGIVFDKRMIKVLRDPASIQMLGVALRQAGDDGVHTYRIPGLATTNMGTLIAVYDVRHDGGGDLPGNIDVGMSRSTDKGSTWEPMKQIMDMGADPNWNFDGIGDPTILVDNVTGTIWVAATWSHGNRSWNGSGPGMTPEETGQFMLVKSDDDGVTWSKPINITEQVKKPEWSFLLQGPGKGFTMLDGTLVIPAQYQDSPNKDDKRKHRLPHSTFIYSKDQGKTWQIATGAYDDTTESQMVQLFDESLMINCRYNREPRRVVMTTTDMGETWTEHSTSIDALVEPRACQASLINVESEIDMLRRFGDLEPSNPTASKFLLFSNPNSLKGRNHITIKASLDSGNSWPAKYQLLIDEQNGRGYSCMSMIDSETVGILYEGSQADLTFQRVKLANILEPPTDQKTTNSALSSFQPFRFPETKPGQFSIARVFGNDMVVQANQPFRVWGTAHPEQDVFVSFEQNTNDNDPVKVTANADGRWLAELPARKSSVEPHHLTVSTGHEAVTLDNILIGEVWLCAGQSNMQFPIRQCKSANQIFAKEPDSNLRFMNFVGAAKGNVGIYDQIQTRTLNPEWFCQGTWQTANKRSLRSLSAVGYHFASELRKELDCPIGIINVSFGGTPIESWLGFETLAAHPDLKSMTNGNWMQNPLISEWCQQRATQNLQRGLAGEFPLPSNANGPNHSFKPGFMFRSAIVPIMPMSIRGVLWYQGESNAESMNSIAVYKHAFPALVESWRSGFQNPQMPIGFVQLPAFERKLWPAFRETQRRSLAHLDERIGMVVAIDTGHPTNVHPIDKEKIGARLSKWALSTTYGFELIYSGPMFKSKMIESNKIRIAFEQAGAHLKTTDGKTPRYFEVSDSSGNFFPAKAIIEGEYVIVSSDQVSDPIDVRYAWVPFPSKGVNLVNSGDLPASPFTTENDF